MNKLSILLLALVLAGGMVFAADIDVTGEASLDFVVDLDDTTNGTGLENGTYTDDISFDLSIASGDGSAAGSGDMYAEIGISAGIDVYDDYYDADEDEAETGDEVNDNIDAWASVDYANVVIGDLTVGILGSPDGFGSAASYYDDDEDGEADVDAVAPGIGDGDGVTLSYQGYTLGADFGGGDYALSAQGSVDVADGITVSPGAAYDGTFVATVAAAAEVSGAVVDAAVDYDGTDVDLAANVVFDPITLDVYFATGPSPDETLDAKVAVDIDPISLSVDGRDLADTIDLSVSASTTVDALAVTVGFGYVVDTTDWDVSAELGYTYGEFALTLGGSYAKDETIGLYASAETTTIIDGATVGVYYDGDDLTGVNPVDVAAEHSNLGTLSAGVTIAL